MRRERLDRREFLRMAGAGSCAAHLCLALGATGGIARRLFAAPVTGKSAGAGAGGRIVGVEPWGRIEELAEGAWALVSTPLAGGDEAMRTLSNGGIIAGRDGVLLVEAFASEEGARWMVERCRALTGRAPTHVVVTHYHGDHSIGLPAYREAGLEPLIHSTEATREDLAEAARERGRGQAAVETLRGAGVELLAPEEPVTLDLGGRVVRIVPRGGHTRSDLAVELEDPRLVWCGDLVWNGMFPNYMDARPSELSRHVRALLDVPAERWVPGHGAVADRGALRSYVALLDDVEAAARRAIEAGTPLGAAAVDYAPPVELGEWVMFSDRYHEVAFGAWERELTGPGP